jgi:hypothetical protein
MRQYDRPTLLSRGTRVIPERRLSHTICRGTPPKNASALTWALIQSGSDWLQTASA